MLYQIRLKLIGKVLLSMPQTSLFTPWWQHVSANIKSMPVNMPTGSRCQWPYNTLKTWQPSQRLQPKHVMCSCKRNTHDLLLLLNRRSERCVCNCPINFATLNVSYFAPHQDKAIFGCKLESPMQSMLSCAADVRQQLLMFALQAHCFQGSTQMCITCNRRLARRVWM